MADQRARRRLAAILAADIVGYGRLMEVDEAGTLEALKARRTQVLDPLVARHHGRIFKTTGDGVLVEFASAVNAVQCAVDLQRAMAAANRKLPDDRQIVLRIGLNLGDVMIEDDDLYGDGVNIAARLEAIAEPGGICLSGMVHQNVKTKLKVAFEDIGDQRLKNVAEPIRVYRVRPVGDSTPASGATPALPLSDKPSIAVLPFANLSGDPEQEYFSDGLTEDIITLLSAWRSFPVIARNSSFAFKNQSRDVRLIARELSARYVLEGSMRKSTHHVRVTAQLIDAELGHHIWAKKFEGALEDIFALQDEITLQIVSSVEPELEKAELRKIDTRRPASMGAWECYLRGREHLHAMTPAQNLQARAMFERAIEIEPQYSAAVAGLSMTYQREMLFEATDDRAAWEGKALHLARRAVALDAESSIAHYALSGAFIWSNQHAHSIAEARMAVQLNPSDIAAWLALGNRLDIVGQSAEGISILERTLERNPRNPHNHVYYGQLGRAYINAHNYEKALDLLGEAVRLRPEFPNTYHLLAICLGHLGRIEEAQAAARQCEQLQPGFMARRAHWNIYLDPDANAHLADGLRKAGLVQ
jgi:adenylate cyclase